MSDSLYRSSSSPLGARPSADGVNFSVFSKHATGVELLLFDLVDDARPARIVRLDPGADRTYHYWHAFVPDSRPGQLYGYRIEGPDNSSCGMRFDPTKLLLDPYGRGVMVPERYCRDAARHPGDNAGTAMKSVVLDVSANDWGGDVPLRRPSSQTIVYEMHVRGFTRHPSSGLCERKRGTFAGLIEKIPYLQQLGVTAVELLPVFQFDVQDSPLGLVNYWGYAPVSFFAPHHAYSSRRDPLDPVDEFRDMVKALHCADLEVILDVVFNHTAERDHRGPTLSFRGLDNPTYYILEDDRARYANYSGTGNTLNANHPIVRRMIVDSLRYWVETMHVDGFRFDLASILARDPSGQLIPNPPVLWDIESDPVLAGTKLIAEAWDQGGNNTAYCLDDETNWFDWTLVARRADVHASSLLNARRVLRDVDYERQRVTLGELIRQTDLMWHGEAARTGLEPPVAQPCVHGERPAGADAVLRYPQRLLGASGVCDRLRG